MTAPQNPGRISIGNAENFPASRGWFVGNFLDADAGARKTSDVEVKWGAHPAGEGRTEVAPGGDTASLAVLISGLFEIGFPDQSPDRALLARQGDFALYEPGVAHTWRALADSVILTVRWRPSTPAPQHPFGMARLE